MEAAGGAVVAVVAAVAAVAVAVAAAAAAVVVVAAAAVAAVAVAVADELPLAVQRQGPLRIEGRRGQRRLGQHLVCLEDEAGRG